MSPARFGSEGSGRETSVSAGASSVLDPVAVAMASPVESEGGVIPPVVGARGSVVDGAPEPFVGSCALGAPASLVLFEETPVDERSKIWANASPPVVSRLAPGATDSVAVEEVLSIDGSASSDVTGSSPSAR
jgi:hypothetical protein